MAFPYLKWISSRCCYGIPYCAPYTGDADGAAVEEEDAQLLRSSSNARDTYIINGKEYKKRSKKAKKSALSEDATALDPINQLGFGIVAYIDMLYYMIWAFGLYTLLLVPVVMFYANGKAYEGISKKGYAAKTIGNLGYSSYECQSIPVQVN